MVHTWPNEIEKWDTFKDLRWCILHGRHKDFYLDYEADIYLLNPDGLKWFASRGGFERFENQVLCVDESTKFKSHSTQRFKILAEHTHLFNRRWILTGTPTPQGAMDLFGQIYILDLGRALGKRITHFRREFFKEPTPFNPYYYELKEGAFETIVERVAPLTMRLKAEDYLKMPKLVMQNIEVELPPEARALYRELERDFYVNYQGHDIIAANSAVAGGKLRQICNGTLYVNDHDWLPIHNEKLEALSDLLEELGGAPVIIFYEFLHDVARIREHLGYRVPSFTEDIRVISDFNSGKVNVMLGHPGSTPGLNIQERCAHVIWFGIPWDLFNYQQAVDRVYRQGQRSDTVYSYHIVAKNAKDEDVIAVLAKKDATQEELMEAIDVKSREV